MPKRTDYEIKMYLLDVLKSSGCKMPRIDLLKQANSGHMATTGSKVYDCYLELVRSKVLGETGQGPIYSAIPEVELLRYDYNPVDTSYNLARKRQPPTKCKSGDHFMTPENTYVRKSGAYLCRECQRVRRNAAVINTDNPIGLAFKLLEQSKRDFELARQAVERFQCLYDNAMRKDRETVIPDGYIITDDGLVKEEDLSV